VSDGWLAGGLRLLPDLQQGDRIEAVLIALEFGGQHDDRFLLLGFGRALADPLRTFEHALPARRQFERNELVGELDQQDRVLGGQPDQHHHADHAEQVQRHPRHPERPFGNEILQHLRARRQRSLYILDLQGSGRALIRSRKAV